MTTDTISKVEQTCVDLIANQQPVTFTQVAARTSRRRLTQPAAPARRRHLDTPQRFSQRTRCPQGGRGTRT
ncbi:hypothetical protein [Micromonospora carbonacea]|uniref:hypothetical protein n=1 Tax=Micromonospora carbonacea TaxID=47853 RepID=UPI00114CC7CE|nr:hypothetical protein [Micromonospora carbonacea]